MTPTEDKRKISTGYDGKFWVEKKVDWRKSGQIPLQKKVLSFLFSARWLFNIIVFVTRIMTSGDLTIT